MLIQQHRLVNEILGQRTNLRRCVLEEQARQKKLEDEVVVVDKEEGLCAVASKHSKWGVEIAKSSRWLHRDDEFSTDIVLSEMFLQLLV